MNMKKIAAVIASAAVASALAVSASAEVGGVLFQCGNWSHRDTLNQPGLYEAMVNDEPELKEIADFSCTDVDIKGDGQYTASLKFGAMEDGKDGDATFWNLLFIGTNIKAEDYPDVNIKIDKLTVDGKEVALKGDALLNNGFSFPADKVTEFDNATVQEPTVKYYSVELFNTWGTEDSQKVISSSDFGHDVSITFTVSGMSAGGDTTTAADSSAADTTTGAAGNTNKPTNDKNNADTGIEGVAVVAGLAVIAVGAVIVAKKRK